MASMLSLTVVALCLFKFLVGSVACKEGECTEKPDATSLMQMKKVVQHGTDRSSSNHEVVKSSSSTLGSSVKSAEGHTKLDTKLVDMLGTNLSADLIQKFLDDLHADHSTAYHGNHSARMKGYWKVTDQDKEDMKDVLNLVPEFKWTEAEAGWTFPFTRKTAQETYAGALSLHMIHRHGLGPLLVSKHRATFAELWTSKGGNSPQDFTRLLESLPQVEEIHRLMSLMSTDGLRNVHSFDHDWSLDKGYGQGCSRTYVSEDENPGNCALQLAFDEPTFDVMKDYGFTLRDTTVQEQQWKTILSRLPDAWVKGGPVQQDPLGEKRTGWVNGGTVSQPVAEHLKAMVKGKRHLLWGQEDAEFFQMSLQMHNQRKDEAEAQAEGEAHAEARDSIADKLESGEITDKEAEHMYNVIARAYR